MALLAALTVYVLLARASLRRCTVWDGFLLLGAINVGVYLVAPSEVSDVSYIQDRLSLFPFFAIVLWLAAHAYSARARYWARIGALVLAVSILGLHAEKYRASNEYLNEYVSANDMIEPNSTLLPIFFSQVGNPSNGRPLSMRSALLLNSAGYIAAERGVVDLGNYEAGQTMYFPIVFRTGLNPAVHLDYQPLDADSADLQGVPQGISSYPDRTGGRIDYVLLWGLRDDQRSKAALQSLLTQLRNGYTRIYWSKPRGLAELYRRAGLELEAHAPN